jgi:hypothetical protein
MLRTASARSLSTGARTLILAGILGFLLAMAGIVAGATAAAASSPSAVAAATATTEPAPGGGTEEPLNEEPLDEQPQNEQPLDQPGDNDNVIVNDNDGFPLWATILLIALGIILIAAIAFAATRNRDRRDRI